MGIKVCKGWILSYLLYSPAIYIEQEIKLMSRIPRAPKPNAQTSIPGPCVSGPGDATVHILVEDAMRITFWAVRVDWFIGEKYVPAFLILIFSKRELFIQRVVDAELFFRRWWVLGGHTAGSEWVNVDYST
jgi:hypothetical protein